MPLGAGRLLSDIETQIRPIEQDADIARAARLLGPALWARVWVQFLQGRRSPRGVVSVSFVETPSLPCYGSRIFPRLFVCPGTCQIEHARLPPKGTVGFFRRAIMVRGYPWFGQKVWERGRGGTGRSIST